LKPSIVIVEDDSTLRGLLENELRRTGFDAASAGSWSQARVQIREAAPDVVLLDVSLPDSQGFGPLVELAGTHPVVMLTAYGSINQAVEAMRLGASDYLVKPVNLDELELVLRRAIERSHLQTEHDFRHSESGGRYTGGMIGDSVAMQQVRRLVDAVGPTEKTVLVQGESGAGKELVAHAIHDASPRREGNFVVVDCATLQDTLFESELFGHERGAFTGADRRKPGLIEVARGGTLFLDELGEVGPPGQAKLLRAIETGRFRRVGATEDQRADVRVVAATNRDLAAMVQAGSFRADLFYRLAGFVIVLPPLRTRLDDVPALAGQFLRQMRTSYGEKRLASAALQRLQTYQWPGNVRELRNVLERAAILSLQEPEILPAHLGNFDVPLFDSRSSSERIDIGGEPTLDEIERTYLKRLLEKHQGNRRRVAAAMGVSERTAYRMLERHGLK
jgi:DNA-binding NtrC family response regulator